MNYIDNGIKEVIEVERVINDEELYFLVTFTDWYERRRQRKFMSIKNMLKKSWSE